LAPVAVGEVVHEAVPALETQLLELALVRDGARPVALVREQARTVEIGPFDDEDFSFLAGLQIPEIELDVVDLVGDEPRRRGAHGRLPFGRWEHATRMASSLDSDSEGSRDATEDSRDKGVHGHVPLFV